MKRLHFILALLCLTLSCKKQSFNPDKSSDYLEVVRKDLQQSMKPEDFKNLDFAHALLSTGDSGRLFYLRVPFKEKAVNADEFVLLKTTIAGHVKMGKILTLNEDKTTNRLSIGKRPSFNGDIIIQSLSRKVEVSSPIKDGFIRSFQIRDSTARLSYVTPDPYIELPEVIVVSSYSSSGGISWSTWYSVVDMLGGSSSGGGGGGWYASGSSYSGSGGGAGGGTDPISILAGETGVSTEQMIYIRLETEVNNPAIPIENYLHCFKAIPDLGATCKITIYTDLPVNGDPTKLFDFGSGSPGHSWIRVEKTNGTQTVSQHIGFYPDRDWKAGIGTSPIPGKFVDNGNHEYNASYELTITPAQLQTGITRMIYLSRVVKYDIDDYNCTDWALDVFNNVVNPDQYLTIPKFAIPGGVAASGSNTPQGLFIKLRNMFVKIKTPGVELPIVGTSGRSTGLCN